MKTVLLTGASSGIGEALAYLIASKNLSLILTGRDKSRLEKMAQKVKALTWISIDLEKEEERKQLHAAIVQYSPDLLINNAGFGLYGEACDTTIEQQLSMIEVNETAALELTLFAAKHFLKLNQPGIILNVSSVAGEFPTPGMSVYGATKSFLTHVSQALNTELKSKGVHVLVACPGTVATDFARRAGSKSDVKNDWILTPEQVAKLIWRQIEKKKEKTIINWYYYLSVKLGRFFPEIIAKGMVWRRIKQRLKP